MFNTKTDSRQWTAYRVAESEAVLGAYSLAVEWTASSLIRDPELRGDSYIAAY
jgi:hypothetical protein